MTEYYPTLKEVLDHLGEDGILVGSATTKPLSDCKDYDFVVNKAGLDKLMRYSFYLYQEDTDWWQYIPLSTDAGKAVDFFHGLCNVADQTKFENRLTYEEASIRPLQMKCIEGAFVLSL